MTSIILMTNFLRAITENMRQFSSILRTPFHSLLSSFTCKTIARTPDGIRIVSKEHTYTQSVASHPEFFAQYAVGISVYNKYRPQETYVIAQLFIASDATALSGDNKLSPDNSRTPMLVPSSGVLAKQYKIRFQPFCCFR